MKIPEYPVKELGAKSLLTVAFLYSKRIMLQQNKLRKRAELNADAQSNRSSIQNLINVFPSGMTWHRNQTFHVIVIWIWTWITALTLFGYDFMGDTISLFKVTYMGLFLMFNILFQISFKFWRICLRAFWTFVIFYSMIVLTLIYTYQFDDFPEFLENYLHISKDL
jgi:hypothetical protein